MHTTRTPSRPRRRPVPRTLFATAAAVALLGAGAVLLGTGSAAASGAGGTGFEGPTVTRPPADPETYAAGDVCPFPVRVVFPVNQEVQRTWTDAAGNPVFALASGPLVARAINLDTGRATVVDLDGTGNFSFLPDGSFVLSGGGGVLASLHTGDSPPNELLFSPVTAKSFLSIREATVDGRTVKTVLALDGPHTDLCQVLAGR
jgi:hypothetical protein